MSNVMPHAEIPLPKPQVHAKHPFRNAATHQTLLDYLQPRLVQGKQARDNRLARMVRIDKSVAGWMKLDDDDRERALKQEREGIPQAVTMNLPLTFVHLDDMMTYFAQTFAPNRGMFYQQGSPNEVAPSQQIVTLMNNHAIYSGYFRQILLTTWATLKYNLGGFTGYWSQDLGTKLAKGTNDEDIAEDTIIWQGNRLDALDMYNTFWDPSVEPARIHIDGEWAARAMLCSHFHLQKKCLQGLYYNCEDELANDSGMGSNVYYRSPPVEANFASGAEGSDWVSILNETPEYGKNQGFELTEITIRLNPIQLNLIAATKANARRNRYEVWRFTLLNNRKVIDATPMNNIHNFIPYFFGIINDDNMASTQKSVAEIIKPLQDFASFLLNTHVKATRKNIWGLTVYDPTVVDLKTLPDGEVAGRVPSKPTGAGKRLEDAIWEHKGSLDTKQTMQDLEATMGIIAQFFPTQSLPSQIASIDRAVDSQVAAVQQGANRRMQKGARLLDDTLFRPMRFAFYYNIIQYQPDGAMVSDFYGKPVQIDLKALRETDLPFIIGQGLKAIDRQAAASQLQNIIFALVQNPATAERVDFMGIIDYWTSMIDIDIDMKQFALQPPTPPPGVGHNGGPPLGEGGAAAPAAQTPPA